MAVSALAGCHRPQPDIERVISLFLMLFLVAMLPVGSVALASATPDTLSPSERAWLQDHGPIRYMPQRFFPPLEFRGASNSVSGITPDLLRIISTNLGVAMEWVRAEGGPREAVASGRADAASSWADTRLPAETLAFTRPFLWVTNVYIVRAGSQVKNSSDLANLTVGVLENSAAHEWTKTRDLPLSFVTVATSREGLLLVSSGRLDAMLDRQWLAQRLMALDGLLNLRFLPDAPYATPRQFVVQATNTILLSILEKGLDSITPAQRHEVISTWSGESPPKSGAGLPPWLWQTLVGLGGAGALLALWVLLLQRQVARRTRELEESREHFRGLYENTPVPYHSLDQSGNVIEVNAAWLEMMHCGRNEVLGRELMEFVEKADVPALASRFEQLKRDGKAPSHEFALRRKNGERVLVAIESMADIGPDGRLRRTHCILHNLTERKKAEAALHENRTLLRAIVEGTEDAIFAKDAEGRYLLFNQAAARMTRKSPSDIIGKDDTALFPPDEARELIQRDREIMRSGENQLFDEMITLGDGRKHALLVMKGPLRSEDGKVIGTFGMSRDMTERVRVTEALQVSEARLAASQRMARLGSWELVLERSEDLDERELWWSDEVYRIFGHEPGKGAVTTALFLQSVHPDDREAVARTVREAVASGRPYQIEHRILLADGSEKVLFEHAEVHRDSLGKRIWLSGTVQDITETKRHQQALEEQQRFISAVAGNTPDYIVVFDVIRRRAVYQNRKLNELLGYGSTELADNGAEALLKLMHPDDTLRFYEHLEQLSRSDDQARRTFEFRMRRSDGAYAWFETRDAVFKRGAGGDVELVLSVAQDVTQRKFDEQRIRHLNRVYAVLSDINQMIVRSNEADAMLQEACCIAVQRGGFCLAWIGRCDCDSDTLEIVAQTGASPQTLDVLSEIFNAPGSPCVFTAEAFRTGSHSVCNDIAADPRAAPWRDEALKRGYRSMASFALRMGDRPFGVLNLYSTESSFFDEAELQLLDELAIDISFALEISRRETLRRQVEEAHQRLATAVEQAVEAILITDAQGDTLYVNPAFERVTGYASQEVLGRNPRILKGGTHDEAFYRQMWDTLTQGKVWNGRLLNKRKDGSLFEEEATISPIRDAAGQITNYVAVKRDVTREVAMQAELRQAQKMEAVGQLAGGVAHDFNNILAALFMGLELLREKANNYAELKAGFLEMHELVQRAASLTRQLLLFGRRQIMQPRVIDLNSLLGNLLKMLGRLIGEHVVLSFHGSQQALWIEADPGMIEQVITNLVVNARDAMPRGGHLTLRSTLATVDGRHLAAHPEARVGTYAVLVVSDTGTGMTAEVLKHAFEPFFTTKDVGKGTGLGLSTVYGIVQQHRGWVEAESEPGRGSAFKVYIPATVNPGQAPESPPPERPSPRGRETILVVEDEPVVRELTVLTLQRLGYTVLEAANAREAMEVWQASDGAIALLLSDVVMPGAMSGVELAEKLRQTSPRLRVILMSGYSGEMIDSGGVGPTGASFIQKPFSASVLGHKVREMLDAR